MSRSRLGAALVGAAAGMALGWIGATLVAGTDGGDVAVERLEARQDERMAEVARLVEEDARAVRESAMQQFYLLQAFRQIGVDGQGVVHVVPGGADAGPTAMAAALRVPRLAVDAGARAAWTANVERLTALDPQVDPGVLDAFRSVRELAEAHPWPPGGLAAATASDWGRPDVIERWLTANRALVSRVDGVLSGY